MSLLKSSLSKILSRSDCEVLEDLISRSTTNSIQWDTIQPLKEDELLHLESLDSPNPTDIPALLKKVAIVCLLQLVLFSFSE